VSRLSFARDTEITNIREKRIYLITMFEILNDILRITLEI